MGCLVTRSPGLVVIAPRPAVLALDSRFWQGRRVLLTGHTGFKGAWLALWLRQLGAEVQGVALAPEGTPNLYQQLNLEDLSVLPGSLQSALIDICELQPLATTVQAFQPEVVFHLAAQPLVRRSYAEPLLTWQTNVMGTLNLFEALRSLRRPCAVLAITTDKVYRNQEWWYGYRETDALGGHDPYSASKAAAELLIDSWRSSFCGDLPHQTPWLAVASARAGNVIGGGDWASDRIVPDAMRACAAGEVLALRHPDATRPWQHVLEPLAGYLLLGQLLLQDLLGACDGTADSRFRQAWNFGPALESNCSVRQLVEALHAVWPGAWRDASDPSAVHEAGLLHLVTDKAHHQLGWRPRWDLTMTAERTAGWYRRVHEGASPLRCCVDDLEAYWQSGGMPVPA